MSNLGMKRRELIAHPSILTLASRIEAIYREMDRDEGLNLPNGARSETGPAPSGRGKDARIEEIQAQIEDLPANDLAEAAIHAMLATARIEYLRSCLNDAQAAQLVPAEKLIRSVLGILIRELDLGLAPFGGKRYLPESAALTAAGA